MLKRTVEHIGDDLHVAVAVGIEALAGLDGVWSYAINCVMWSNNGEAQKDAAVDNRSVASTNQGQVLKKQRQAYHEARDKRDEHDAVERRSPARPPCALQMGGLRPFLAAINAKENGPEPKCAALLNGGAASKFRVHQNKKGT